MCVTELGTDERAPSVLLGSERSRSAQEVEKVLSVNDVLRTPSAYGSQKSVSEKAPSVVGSQRAESSVADMSRESSMVHETGLYIIFCGIFLYCIIREAMENHDIVPVLMEN